MHPLQKGPIRHFYRFLSNLDSLFTLFTSMTKTNTIYLTCFINISSKIFKKHVLIPKYNKPWIFKTSWPRFFGKTCHTPLNFEPVCTYVLDVCGWEKNGKISFRILVKYMYEFLLKMLFRTLQYKLQTSNSTQEWIFAKRRIRRWRLRKRCEKINLLLCSIIQSMKGGREDTLQKIN